MCYPRRFSSLRVSTFTSIISPGNCTHCLILRLRTKCAFVGIAPWVVLLAVAVMRSLGRKDQVATLAGPVAFRFVRGHVLVGWNEAIA